MGNAYKGISESRFLDAEKKIIGSYSGLDID
jgi:hypothetical protein